MSINKITVSQLLIILGLVILVIPPILINNSFFEFFNYSDKGQIGDTIGGITAPFINAIGAILVFIAFKEQVKANDLIKEQQYFQHIQEQINRLEDEEFINLYEVIQDIERQLMGSEQLLDNFEGSKQVAYYIDGELLNKATYTTAIFQQTSDLIDKMDNNKAFMQKKIKTLYKIIYQDNYRKLDTTLKGVLHMKSNSDLYIADLLLQIKDLETRFGD